MTTEFAAAMYEADHVASLRDRKPVVFNPHDRPYDELFVIYGFNNGGPKGWCEAVLIGEDGTPLGNHICTSEAYMRNDLGILEGTRPDRHKEFQSLYPDGYRMEFVSWADAMEHQNLNKAIKLAEEKASVAAVDHSSSER